MKHVIVKQEKNNISQSNIRDNHFRSLKTLAVATGLVAASVVPNVFHSAYAEETGSTSFQVNVQESLSVSITTPSIGAIGNVDTFLRNEVVLDVVTNTNQGFTASMYSKNDTNLSHVNLGSSYTIPTLASSSTRGNFPANRWGYSLASASFKGNTYGETSAGNDNSYYYPLVSTSSTPITVLESASAKTGSQNIYFGTKASTAVPSGTYSNTVVFSVVTGLVDSNNPITPTNPDTPSTDNPNTDTNATYTGSTGTGATQGVGSSGSTGTTVYSVISSNATNQTDNVTTEITAGDNTNAYPKGVSTTSDANIASGSSSLPIGLAATAATAATAGIIFFIVAKKRDDDDEEEEQ